MKELKPVRELNFNQILVIDSSKCIFCDQCYNICPQRAIMKIPNPTCSKCIKYCISMQVPCNRENYVICADLCDSCGLCVTVCDHEAIFWEKLS